VRPSVVSAPPLLELGHSAEGGECQVLVPKPVSSGEGNGICGSPAAVIISLASTCAVIVESVE